MSDPILELLAAPPSPALSVDETAVHAGGRRRLRRRNLRRVGLGAGVAVAAAAIAFTTLGSGLGGDALPAGPPAPVDAGPRVSASLFDGSYSVEVRPGAPDGQPNVVFFKGSGATRQQLAGSSAEATVVSMGTGSGADGVMLGTAPASAEKFLTLTKDGASGYSMDEQPLSGTAYKALALRFDVPGDTDKYLGTVWMNSRGEVRSSTGARLPGSRLDHDTDQFFVDRTEGHMGVFTEDGGSTVPLSPGLSTTMGYGSRAKGEDWDWRFVTLLPEGTTDVRLTWADATKIVGPVLRTPPGAGGVIAQAEAWAPGTGPAPRITSVSWTDEAGTRHTEAVK